MAVCMIEYLTTHLRIAALICLVLPSLLSAVPKPEQLLLDHSKAQIEKAELKSPKQQAFVRSFLGSKEWQHEFWDSGPVLKPAKSLQTLYQIWDHDRQLSGHRINRQMATALALEAPRRQMKPKVVRERYDFFRTRFASGRLNSAYNGLSVFERRYLANGIQHNRLNTIECLQYLNDEVSLPVEHYRDACWYPRYRSKNPFGDSIHGRFFYRPFEDSWGSGAEMVRNVGGVCGSLSNFGAAAAVANGIPAATMGEPGHCAFTIRVEPGKWTSAYSLSWKRTLHNAYYQRSWGWHILTTKAHDSREDAIASGNLRRLTLYHLDQQNSRAALDVIRAARTRYPLHWPNWKLSTDVLKQAQGGIKEWQRLHRDVLRHLAPVSNEVAFHLLDQHIYAKVLPKGDEALALRKKILLSYHTAFSDWGLGRWGFSHALRRQLERYGGNDEKKDQFMVEVFAIHAKGNTFPPIILEEQLKIIGEDEPRRQRYIGNISRRIQRDGESKAYRDIIEGMAAKLLPHAAQQGDRATFQFIGKLASEFYPPLDIQAEPFPGILLSSGGTLRITKPGNRWDDPIRHWGVLEPHGGFFHTNHKPATATVQLGNFGRLSGVVIVLRNSHLRRIEGARLEVSTDGREWTAVHTFKAHQRIHRVNLRPKEIDAGYVRVIHPNNSALHFQKFHVYGIKQN